MPNEKKRNLDGCYFRVQRDGKWESICFSDLTEEERNGVLEGRNEEWLKSLCCHLADSIKTIGNWFDIECVSGEVDNNAEAKEP